MTDISLHTDSPTNNVGFLFASAHEEMNPRRRNTMEDCHRIVPNLLSIEDTVYSYFAVYDGHGGRQIVDFLEENLESNIATELLVQDEASIFERLLRCYLITDMQSKKLNITTSGATAISALLETKLNPDKSVQSRTLYTANVGDSRAVLVFKDESEHDERMKYSARRLSFDHRPDDIGEQLRIKNAGGFITRSRVLGILAVTRSFGDHGMKDFVSAEPYLSSTELDGFSNCPMLILACDGVWDVLSDQDAAELLMDHYSSNGGPSPDAAQVLVKKALELGSTDNITAIVIFL